MFITSRQRNDIGATGGATTAQVDRLGLVKARRGWCPGYEDTPSGRHVLCQPCVDCYERTAYWNSGCARVSYVLSACIMYKHFANKYMDGWMDGWMDVDKPFVVETSLIMFLTYLMTIMDVDPGAGGFDPWKYVGGVRVCFDPLKCHIRSFKNLLDNCKFHIIKYERFVSKMEAKTNVSKRLQAVRNRNCWVFGNYWRRLQSETVWRLDPTDPDPHILRLPPLT